MTSSPVHCTECGEDVGTAETPDEAQRVLADHASSCPGGGDSEPVDPRDR